MRPSFFRLQRILLFELGDPEKYIVRRRRMSRIIPVDIPLRNELPSFMIGGGQDCYEDAGSSIAANNHILMFLYLQMYIN